MHNDSVGEHIKKLKDWKSHKRTVYERINRKWPQLENKFKEASAGFAPVSRPIEYSEELDNQNYSLLIVD